jgi:hypothetical protein
MKRREFITLIGGGGKPLGRWLRGRIRLARCRPSGSWAPMRALSPLIGAKETLHEPAGHEPAGMSLLDPKTDIDGTTPALSVDWFDQLP